MSECVWEQTFPARRMVACTYRREDREAESPVVIDQEEGLLQKYTIHGEPCRDVRVLVFVGEDTRVTVPGNMTPRCNLMQLYLHTLV